MRRSTFRGLLLSTVFILHTALSQSLLDSLAIEVRATSREFAYTNKETAYFYGETNSENTSGWQGFNVYGNKFLDDYEIRVDGMTLDRTTATTIVYPDYLKRIYPSGIVEELRLADSLALFSVSITSAKPVALAILPFVNDARDATQFEIQQKAETVLLARKDHLHRAEKKDYPVWLAVGGIQSRPVVKTTKKGRGTSPFMLVSGRSSTHIFAFAAGNEKEEARTVLHTYLTNKAKVDLSRRARMELLLQQTHVETENARFNKALAWAKLSLDALLMNQGARGIFAGLPWFNDYWGRDTFISLPGATLVQGRWNEARAILRSFAAFQQKDSTSMTYGRIPNRVTTTGIGYNTADGTPRMVMMAREYVERSGDTAFVREIYPTIFHSMRGTLRYHSDSLGFLTHGDQETWMDAAGPEGCWSPRGNRANDIQALWAEQLRAGIWFAARLGDSTSSRRWNEQLLLLEKNFQKYFLQRGIVADHLTEDGSRNIQLRPNQIFLAPLLPEGARARVLHSVINGLTYEYGVASLSQQDENFHPYHQHEPFYPKDAAYHNGTVWTWLQGPVISELCKFGKNELAWKLTENTVHQILDRDAVGTQSELLDAIALPGKNEPRASGTFSQAWNLAEFIRNFYDDYLGVTVRLLDHHLVLRPMLPPALGSIRATINLGGRALPIEVLKSKDSTIVTIDGKNLRKGGTAEIILPGTECAIRTTLTIAPSSNTKLKLIDSQVSLYSKGSKRDDFTTTQVPAFRSYELDSLQFSTPTLKPGLKSLAGPGYDLISHAVAKSANRLARTVVSAIDPVGDDVGTGAYRYPLNPNFIEGSLDITRFSVSHDENNAYFTLKFRTLANPGWHPEYGFQLTYAAIAIDEDGIWSSGKLFVEHNGNYPLEKFHAYEKLILIGGGVQLEDKNGRILCAYIAAPTDVSNPLGNPETGTISFAIPLSFIGKPMNGWTWTVLVGAQDDHGGAGIGEFRAVNAEAGEWNGGGKTSTHDPNVYDVLVAPARQSNR